MFFFASFISVILRPAPPWLKSKLFLSHMMERSGSCPSITHRQNRSFSNLSMILPNQCWLLSMRKKKIHSLSPPQRVCCVCVNKFTFCVNQNAFRAKCMKRLCMWIKFMPATFAAMFLSPGFQAGGKFWKIKIQK